ncbi:MAG: metalloregulator ArsR/SmtB family transcription factor [Actinobacteria bacterium]|nr:metalloregulator ArsR/SmtB family transcription factor [Actinomycetota bacterium]
MATTTTPVPVALAAARFFRVLGDPTRVAILQLLLQRPHSVSELVEATGARQSRVSTHLACLRWCELVTTERAGRKVIYSITDPEVGQVLRRGMELAQGRLDHLLACERIGPEWA